MKKQAPRKKPAKGTGAMIRERWDAAIEAVAKAEADLEKQVRHMIKKNKVAGDAADAFKELRGRLNRERRKVAKELDTRLSGLQARVKKERKALSHLVDDAVHGALVALNIPSRKEVAELTRKVDELSRKIDAFKAPAKKRPAVKPVAKPVIPPPSAEV